MPAPSGATIAIPRPVIFAPIIDVDDANEDNCFCAERSPFTNAEFFSVNSTKAAPARTWDMGWKVEE